MYYSITHTTEFRYVSPIRESVMEVRMQPRNEGGQRCLTFTLTTTPAAQVTPFRDHIGNTVHHFDIPGRHERLRINAEALVTVNPLPMLPAALDEDAWDDLDALTVNNEYWDWLMPSHFAQPSDLLRAFAAEIGLRRGDDPLSTLRALNTTVYNAFEYAPQTTTVDSPIDDALRDRRGVCQDLAHIMTTLVRELHIPCRYVSGYLYHGDDKTDRSAADATHAWVEALLPGVGWIGFDPTNNLLTSERHIRVAVGRDYSDVTPSRGVYKGRADAKLTVAVRVSPSEQPPPDEITPQLSGWIADESPATPDERDQQEQQQQ